VPSASEIRRRQLLARIIEIFDPLDELLLIAGNQALRWGTGGAQN
jgi:hypothetical protein